MKNDVIRGAVLIGAAIVVALVSNALASRQRKLVLPGYYPNATKVTREAEPPRPAPAPAVMPIDVPAAAPVEPAATPSRPKNPKPQQPATRSFPPHPDQPYVEIGYDDVAYLHRQGALFLDARRTSIFEQGHIAGARPYSVWESDIDEKVNRLFEERNDPRQQLEPVVIYCSGGDCEDSHMLSQKLWGVGFNNVYVYKDGFPDWQTRGGATETGAAP
jgi:rhodanese-related sulfurtransferase